MRASSLSSRLMPAGGSASRCGQRVVAVIQLRRPTSTWRVRSSNSTSRNNAQPARWNWPGRRTPPPLSAGRRSRSRRSACRRRRSRVAGQPRQLLRRQHADRAEGQRGEATPDQHVPQKPADSPAAAGKTSVHSRSTAYTADLGQDSKHRNGRCAGSGINRRQPEVQQPSPAFARKAIARIAAPACSNGRGRWPAPRAASVRYRPCSACR